MNCWTYCSMNHSKKKMTTTDVSFCSLQFSCLFSYHLHHCSRKVILPQCLFCGSHIPRPKPRIAAYLGESGNWDEVEYGAPSCVGKTPFRSQSPEQYPWHLHRICRFGTLLGCLPESSNDDLLFVIPQ